MNDLRKLARFIHEISWQELPEDVRRLAASKTLDLVSVAIGAAKDPLVSSAAASICERYGRGGCHVWGREETCPPAAAAMLNAMLAHTLELDDVHTASKTHGSASIIPAAWACAEYLGRSGEEFLLAVVCGYETTNRVGMALGVASHRNKGWHATATCGVFGCAAACAKLLRLSEDETVWALGMAGTQSCGLWAFLGDSCNCKVLHTARAAASGMEAAFLAQAGMTGPEHIFEAEDGGLLAAMSDDFDVAKISAGLGTVYEIRNMDMKPYPCCRSAHCVIDAVLRLRETQYQGGEGEDIERIEVATYLVGYKQCAASEGCLHPKTPLEAKFSTPYAAAAAWLYGRVTMAEFEPETIGLPKVQELAGKVKVRPDPRFTAAYPVHWGCEVTLIKTDGTSGTVSVEDASGSIKKPLSDEQMKAKAQSLIAGAYPEKTERIMEDLLTMEQKERLPYWK